jgi:serine/threonine protein kinase
VVLPPAKDPLPVALWKNVKTIIRNSLSAISPGSSWPRLTDDEIIRMRQRLREKTAIIERIKIMMEMTMAVERLHTSEIVHRDLAPDNIMLKSNGEVSAASIPINAGNWNKLEMAQRLLQAQIKVCLIDFGLADKKKHSREWYDDEQVARSREKMAFWSPEAAHVRLQVSTSDIKVFQPDDPRRANGSTGEIRIRSNSAFEFMPRDIVVDRHDTKYDNWIHIDEIRVDKDGAKYAVFSGRLPADYRSAHLDQIPTLGEPHDLFALGALLYHLFVKETALTQSFRDFVVLYGNSGRPVTIDVAAKDEYYIRARDKLPIEYWKDEIMIIAMGAMIRNQEGSFAQNRTEFTAAPVRRFLWALKRLHFTMMADAIQELARFPA